MLPFAASAGAAEIPDCKVRVLQPLTDDLGNHWQPGQTLSMTIERDNASGGSYCASGGSCVPLKINGSDAVRLLNCRVGAAIGDGDRSLVPDPNLAGTGAAQEMRLRSDVERKLSNLGFSDASAGSLADEYVLHPGSANGRLVKSALTGSSAAICMLKQNHP